MTANCETCKHLKGIACTHPELDTMPYEKGCSYWEAMEKEKLTADEIKRGILSKPHPKPQMEPVERKIVQISANAAGGIWALCDDGSLWFGSKDGWREFEPIPLGAKEIEGQDASQVDTSEIKFRACDKHGCEWTFHRAARQLKWMCNKGESEMETFIFDSDMELYKWLPGVFPFAEFCYIIKVLLSLR